LEEPLEWPVSIAGLPKSKGAAEGWASIILQGADPWINWRGCGAELIATLDIVNDRVLAVTDQIESQRVYGAVDVRTNRRRIESGNRICRSKCPLNPLKTPPPPVAPAELPAMVVLVTATVQNPKL
jgi:hypothetical protein